MEIKEGDILSIDEVIKVGLAKKWKIAIYGSENEELPSYDSMAERTLVDITAADGGKVTYKVKSFDDAENTLSVIREIAWK